MIKCPKLLPVLFLFMSLCVKAQSGNEIYIEFGADSLINTGKTVTQLNSGSIFYAGYAQDSLSQWMIQFHKMDINGTILFSKYFTGPSGQAIMERMKLHPDGNFILSATDIDSSGNTQPMLLKVDTNGNIIWRRTYGNGLANGSMLGLNISIDGSILASGFTTDSGFTNIGVLCVRTDANGNANLYKVFSDPTAISTSDACIFTPENDMILSGDIQASANRFSAHALRIDSAGNQIWGSTVGVRLNGGCKNLIIDSNNDLLLIGESTTDSSSNFDIQISKLNTQNGTIKWTKFIRSSNESDAGFSILETADNHYLVTGYGFDTSESRKRIVIILTDTSGNELSKNYYGTGLANIGYHITHSIDGHYLVAGANFTNGKNVLILADPSNWSSISFSNEQRFSIYPNLLHSGEFLKWSQSVQTIDILDASGRIVYRGSGESKSMNTSLLLPGSYLFFTIINGQKFTSKFFIF